MKSHFNFNKTERSGIFFLLLLLAVLQAAYFFLKRYPPTLPSHFALNTADQAKMDSLKKAALEKDVPRIFPFNPNYISDYKGYVLGLSPEALDRLHKYREQNKFVNSAEEFQQVTKASDSLLAVISPYFKFPEWKQKKKPLPLTSKNEASKAIVVQDLNTASAQDLKQIRGIGETLSARIIKFRNSLGGFLVGEQLYDVYGLEMEVADRALRKFKVMRPPTIHKININTASVSEMASLAYIPYAVAEKIVERRMLYGTYKSFDELGPVTGFPKEKIGRIALYLTL